MDYAGRGPIVGGELWRTVVGRSGSRCECSGQCGRKHEGACGRIHMQGREPLNAIPREKTNWRVIRKFTPDELIAACTACHAGIERTRDHQTQDTQTETTVLNGRNPMPSLREIHSRIDDAVEVLGEIDGLPIEDRRKALQELARVALEENWPSIAARMKTAAADLPPEKLSEFIRRFRGQLLVIKHDQFGG